MTQEERKRLTPYEIEKLSQVSQRQQPSCPGCGEPMTLNVGVSMDEWQATYECRNDICCAWRTRVCRGKGIVVCVEDAYKLATRRSA